MLTSHNSYQTESNKTKTKQTNTTKHHPLLTNQPTSQPNQPNQPNQHSRLPETREQRAGRHRAKEKKNGTRHHCTVNKPGPADNTTSKCSRRVLSPCYSGASFHVLCGTLGDDDQKLKFFQLFFASGTTTLHNHRDRRSRGCPTNYARVPEEEEAPWGPCFLKTATASLVYIKSGSLLPATVHTVHSMPPNRGRRDLASCLHSQLSRSARRSRRKCLR